jgi:flagellar biosynthesis protein FlhB
MHFLLPTVILMTAAGVLASVAQNPPQIVPDRILPDASRISLRKGLSRVFGARGWTEFLKSLIKLAAVIAVAMMMLIGQKVVLLTAMDVDPGMLPQRVLDLCVKTVAAVLVATLAVAAADLAWSRILWRRDHRMSKHEVKEELRQAEGDRMIKARLRSLRLDRSRRRMLSAVPRATMVVVNPTHYAVALRYVRGEGGAPTVIAKGADFIALKIRSIAEDHAIPVVEDKPLARSLYAAVDVDRPIPTEFYRAVAEIVHVIEQRKGQWAQQRQ